MAPDYWEKAQQALSAADPVMGRIIAAYQGEMLESRSDPFYTLARSIVGQQISVKAADAVWGRLESRVREAGEMKQGILRLSEEALRACGLSRSKAAYMRNLAEFFEQGRIAAGHWEGMTDEDVIRHLTQVKGIGRWSAEMFLIFHLLRPDVFPVADIGLQKAIALHYGEAGFTRAVGISRSEWKRDARAVGVSRSERKRGGRGGGYKAHSAECASPEPAERRPIGPPGGGRGGRFIELSTQWQPYRSVATWYLWRSLDPVPVGY